MAGETQHDTTASGGWDVEAVTRCEIVASEYLYVQFADHVEHLIRSGVFRPEDPLPDEQFWVRKARWGLATVRRGMRELRDRGITTWIGGQGAFPNPEKFPSPGPANVNYIGVAYRLESDIQDGKYPPGTWLPRSVELAAAHHVSRDTIRKAIRLLRARRVVVTQPRRGIFVPPTADNQPHVQSQEGENVR